MLKIDPRDAKTYWLRAMLQMEAMHAVDLRAKDIDAAILARPDLPVLRGARGAAPYGQEGLPGDGR